MIKKLPFLILYFLFINSLFSQQVTSNPSDCIQNFIFSAKTILGDNQRVDDIVLSWDLSQNTTLNNLELRFEVQPLNACWKGLEGTNRSEKRNIKILNISEQSTGNQVLKYRDLICKCIKWRAIITNPSTNCEVKTDWQFTSFL